MCDEKLLSHLTSYLKETAKESQDMIILNPWLVRPGSAESLSIYLDALWDVTVVMYYRRFFEWMAYKFNGWRQDLFQNSLSPNSIPLSSFRYIDFIREYCKHLFYGKDANEDGFPLRMLHRYDGEGSKKNTRLSKSDFDPTTNFDTKELTGLGEYVYFVAKQYQSQARFRHGVNIVNYHDTHDAETNFYCHVLHDAPNSCKDAVQREQENEPNLDQEMNDHLILIPSIAFEDIAA